MNELSGKNVTIIGIARSGLAAARLVVRMNGVAKISDQGSKDNLPADFEKWATDHHVLIETQGHTREFIEDSDLVVVSPGVRIDADPVQWARAKDIPVIGEIELASIFCPRPMIAVTGSNGKTTVVTLIKEILERSGKKACLCGNVGFPFADYVLDSNKVDYFVLEISSFQLETIVSFKPHVAVFLNFSQNHLDRHKDLNEYFEAKKRIFENQDENDFAILNAEDQQVKALASAIKSKVSFFNTPASFEALNAKNPNFSAVREAVKVLGISDQVCNDVFDSFLGVEHRLEKVRTLEGVDFVNDSKATTAESGRWAMKNIDKPMVMICGGRDKNIDFSVLSELVKEKVKTMVVFGEAKAKLKQTFASFVEVKECDHLEHAVNCARESAATGDCVVLSPMCASFDMFKNFEERGRVFKDIVHKLK